MIAAGCPPFDVGFLACVFVLVGDSVAHLRVATLAVLFTVLMPVGAGAAAFSVSRVQRRTPNHALERMTASPVIRRLDVLGSGHRSAWYVRCH